MSSQRVVDENQPPIAPSVSTNLTMMKSPGGSNSQGEVGLEDFLVTKKAPLNSTMKGPGGPGSTKKNNNMKKGGEMLSIDFGAPAASGSAPASLQENFKRFRKQKVKERRIMMQNKEELATKYGRKMKSSSNR